MAALTTAQEYAALREAIQSFSAGQVAHTVSFGDMSITYTSSQQEWMQQREVELAKRLTQRNVRKRTHPDFDC
jgi:ribosomal protein L16/L10AE